VLTLISGATYGSSFVGMVHVLRTDTTVSSQTMYSTREPAGHDEGRRLVANAEGAFGVSESFANDVKRLLSLQQISSHCSVITMGSIPSIKANDVRIAVKEFAEFDAAKMMEKLATLHNATASDQDSVAKAAADARTGGQLAQIAGDASKEVMTAAGDIEDGHNKMLDINSVMQAFEDYVNKALAGKHRRADQLLPQIHPQGRARHLWVSKYFPQYLAISEDDSGRGGPEPEKK